MYFELHKLLSITSHNGSCGAVITGSSSGAAGCYLGCDFPKQDLTFVWPPFVSAVFAFIICNAQTLVNLPK